MNTRQRSKWSAHQNKSIMPIQNNNLGFFANKHGELKIPRQLIAAILSCNQQIVSQIIHNDNNTIALHNFDLTAIKRMMGSDAENLLENPLRFALLLSLKLSPIQDVLQRNPGQTNIHGIIAFLTSVYDKLHHYLQKKYQLEINLVEDILYFAYQLQNQDLNNALVFPQASSTVSALYLGLSVLADNSAYQEEVATARKVLFNLESGKTIANYSKNSEEAAQHNTLFPAA